jgi:hypothetical protein
LIPSLFWIGSETDKLCSFAGKVATVFVSII